MVRVHPNRMDHSLSSRYCDEVVISPNFYESETELLDFLLHLRRFSAPRVLIPASDDCAYFVAKYCDRLGEEFRVCGPPTRVMEIILNKKRQYQAAEQLGLPIPETYFPGSESEVRELARRLQNFPYIIKPNVAHKWRLGEFKAASKGRKAILTRDKEELIREYAAIAKADPNVMIQAVVTGPDEQIYSFVSYFNAKSEPLGYYMRRKIRQHPLDFGYCSLIVSEFQPTVKEQSIRLLQGIGFQGLSAVEWKYDSRSQRFRLIEINGRAVQTIGLGLGVGMDLPYIAFRDQIGEVVKPTSEYETGKKWLYLGLDLWAAKELHDRGDLSYWGWIKSLMGRCVHAIYARDDLKLFFAYYMQFIRRKVSSRTGKKRLAALSSPNNSLQKSSSHL